MLKGNDQKRKKTKLMGVITMLKNLYCEQIEQLSNDDERLTNLPLFILSSY